MPQTVELVRRPTSAPSQNKLLGALPRDEYERLLPVLESTSVRPKQVLQRQGEEVQRVFFPSRGTCSLVQVMRDGLMIEVGMVGSEGMIGVWLLDHDTIAPCETRVQIGDDALHVMGIEHFREEMSRRGRFADVARRYLQAFLRLTMQSCACNGLHGVDERCCRWLLMVHDRIGRDELPVTQDSLASALGVRRPTITLTINALGKAGLLDHSHRRIIIRDRKGLEAAACECYQAVKANFDQVFAA